MPEITMVCPVCREEHQAGAEQWLEVGVRIGWFSSGGGCPEGVEAAGLCEPCGDALFNLLANTLRTATGQPPLTLDEERQERGWEDGDDLGT